MIYLIQDCYEDQEGNFHRVLKIGYSSKSFDEGRKSHYDTHNYGYKLLSEREGSQDLENYLHKRLQEYHLTLEWFKYDPKVIKIFNEVSEDDISQFKSQEELNRYIRYYILGNLIPSVKKLSNLYLKSILEELHEKSKEYPELEYNEDLLKKEILEVFEFVSSREKEYFENLNFDNKEVKKLLSNTGLNLSQIVGRQRNRNNPFKNQVTLFYRTIQEREIQSWEKFQEIQRERLESTNKLLNLYQKADSGEKVEYIRKLRSDIQVSQYSKDFVSISDKTGQPVHNKFIELADERAWKVSQRDYQDSITVTKALESEYEVQDFLEEENKVFLDFKAKFDGFSFFTDKMRVYCEFMDTYRDSKHLIYLISSHVTEPDYGKFYEYYGTKGCISVGYKRGELEKGMSDQGKLLGEVDLVISSFVVGEKYTKSDIKQKLISIYASLDLSKKAKATDIEDYYEVKPVLIPNKETGKRDKGYLIISRK